MRGSWRPAGGLLVALLFLATVVLIAVSRGPARLGPALDAGATSRALPVDAAELNQRLGRGVNILGYDPIWASPSDARLEERHFQLIQEAGFDHVRVNLHPFRDTDLKPDGLLPEAWFQTIDWAVEQALANSLLVVLDLHEFEVLGSDPGGNRERFLAAWEQIAERYRDAPADVLFELLNEPARQLTPGALEQVPEPVARTRP
ncbi:MAG: cellulase family glycosylhydrolase [Candidatus Nanopelagicales bacterium]